MQARSKSPAPRPVRAAGKSPARSPSPAAKPRAAGKAGKDAQVLRLLALISQKVFIMLFCKSRFTHKSDNLFFTLLRQNLGFLVYEDETILAYANINGAVFGNL